MPNLSAPDYQIARLLIERGIGMIYLIAFLVAAEQFPALSGERGLQPAARLRARPVPPDAEPLPLGLLGPAPAALWPGPAPCWRPSSSSACRSARRCR